jgi:hypothetical protein
VTERSFVVTSLLRPSRCSSPRLVFLHDPLTPGMVKRVSAIATSGVVDLRIRRVGGGGLRPALRLPQAGMFAISRSAIGAILPAPSGCFAPATLRSPLALTVQAAMLSAYLACGPGVGAARHLRLWRRFVRRFHGRCGITSSGSCLCLTQAAAPHFEF